MISEPNYTFKILTLGVSGTGKKSILHRFLETKYVKNNDFSRDDVYFKTHNIDINGKTIKLKIWDTAGQERMRNLTEQYYKGSDGLLLVYDVTDEESYDTINVWLTSICNYNKDIGLVLLGNKIDLKDKIVCEKKGKDLANKLKVSYYETSAVTGQGIKEAFIGLIMDITKKKKINLSQGDNIELCNKNNKYDNKCLI